MPDLGSTISLNASNFAAGVAQTRAKLVELNTALIENRNKMKEVNKEAQELQKQEKALVNHGRSPPSVFVSASKKGTGREAYSLCARVMIASCQIAARSMAAAQA